MKCRAKWIHKTYPLKKEPAPLRLDIAEVLEGPWPLMPAWQSVTGPLPSLLLLSNSSSFRLFLSKMKCQCFSFSQVCISLLSSSGTPQLSSPSLSDKGVGNGPSSWDYLIPFNLRLNKAIRWDSANLHTTS